MAKQAQKKSETKVKKEAAPAAGKNSIQSRKEAVGVVVSDKMMKTIVVRIDRRVSHAAYKKYVKKSNKAKAHDEQNTAKIGDLVLLVETRPLSRDKRWALKKVLRRAGQAAALEVAG
jgi:small subunit ribosomal protein S17